MLHFYSYRKKGRRIEKRNSKKDKEQIKLQRIDSNSCEFQGSNYKNQNLLSNSTFWGQFDLFGLSWSKKRLFPGQKKAIFDQIWTFLGFFVQ